MPNEQIKTIIAKMRKRPWVYEPESLTLVHEVERCWELLHEAYEVADLCADYARDVDDEDFDFANDFAKKAAEF